MISISIDVTQVDKSRIKEVVRRDGKTAKFLELILIDTPNGQYGDYMVKQGVTREEREARKEMPILGNGKILGGSRHAKTEQPAKKPASEKPKGDDPFA